MEHKNEEMSMAMEIVREYKKREKRRGVLFYGSNGLFV